MVLKKNNAHQTDIKARNKLVIRNLSWIISTYECLLHYLHVKEPLSDFCIGASSLSTATVTFPESQKLTRGSNI